MQQNHRGCNVRMRGLSTSVATRFGFSLPVGPRASGCVRSSVTLPVHTRCPVSAPTNYAEMVVPGLLFAVNVVLLIATASGASTSRADPLLHRRRERYSDLYANEGSSTDVDSGECVYPCVCPSADPPDCLPGVVPERDACGCCLVCPRQLGEPCDVTAPCDVHRGLVCRHRHRDKVAGVCREANGLPCVVYNKTYEHGETFTLDCRTQCACQNGTYGCSSLCPQEHISPKGSCNHPRLVDVPGQCCREWMCDSQAIQQPPECQPTFTRWSHCSRECGTGISRRRSNLNAACEATTETRLCQIRRCDGLQTNPFQHDKHHHVRKGHECKATHRLSQPVRLRFGPCRSRKLFRPKYCGGCTSPGVCCEPLLSTTVKVDFLCDPPPPETTDERSADLVLEYMEPGEDMWRDDRSALWDTDGLALTVSIQWILKCRCGDACTNNNNNPTSGITAQPTAASGEIILHRVHRTAAP